MPEAGLLADEVLGRHPPVVERDLVAVHAAIADGVDRTPLHLPDAAVGDRRLGELEAVTVAARLGDDEQAQPAVGLGAVRIGAGEQHQHVGAGAERAPRLDAVDDVAGRAVGAGGSGGGDLDAGDVAAEVGLGDGDCGHHLGGRQLGQPVLLLCLGAALHQGPGEDLRAGDQRAADAERTAAELLGGDHHGDVLAVATLAVAAVLAPAR